jgi:hypothetical protein
LKRKLILGGLVVLGVLGLGYVLGVTAIVLALIALGIGFFIGRRRAAH